MRLQKYLVGSILAIVLIGAASYWFPYKSVEAPSAASLNEEGTLEVSYSPMSALPLKGGATIKELYDQNQDLLCDITSIDNSNGAFSGKLYLTEKNLRGDFAVQQGGRLFSAGMFIISDMLYFWTDTAQERISFRIMSNAPAINDPGPNFSVTINETIAYDCEPWLANLAVFSLPADLSFPEIAE